ncbi:MAG: hypothetical protein V4638_06610 [Bacteroidota bacterium]
MEHHIKSEKSFRYYTHGDIQKATKLLFVFHGYGQLAQFFIRKFHLVSDDYFIVAPEGMHRFYLNGTAGRVGASWMTKEDRENDIVDNLNFLENLAKEFESHNFEEKIILGFSQGGATAARWHFQNKNKFDRLILWASIFPPDLKIENEFKLSSNSKNSFVLGNSDEYFNEDQQKEIKVFYQKLNFDIVEFEGGHDIDFNTLFRVFE